MTQAYDAPTPSPDEAKERLEQTLFEIRRVIAGQDAMLERVLVCLLARGHLLIEDLPGVGKTTLAHVLARSLGLLAVARGDTAGAIRHFEHALELCTAAGAPAFEARARADLAGLSRR